MRRDGRRDVNKGLNNNWEATSEDFMLDMLIAALLGHGNTPLLVTEKIAQEEFYHATTTWGLHAGCSTLRDLGFDAILPLKIGVSAS